MILDRFDARKKHYVKQRNPSFLTKMSFRHIYLSEYQLGTSYQHKKGNQIIELGVLIAKESVGRPYDSDIQLTFKRPDNSTYKHIVDFGPYYREAPNQGASVAIQK